MADFGLSAALSAIGTLVTATGTIASGVAAKNAANFEAAQYKIKAQEERAAAQREAEQQRKETNLLLSRQQAVAAASGLGALDETVQELAGDVIQQGAYREGMIRYGGEERARGYRAQAQASKASGQAAMTGSLFKAAGTIASGFGETFRSKYGGTPPAADGEPIDLLAGGNTGYLYGGYG